MDFLGVDFISLIKVTGYAGIGGIIFVESFFLFFLPGDSLLFTAGFLASQGYFSFFPLIIVCFISAVLGNAAAYAIGHAVGPKIFAKEKSFFFNKAYIEKAGKFYVEHGGKAVFIARFIPAVRTFVPIFAGVGNMAYYKFFFYNIMGALAWAVGIPFAGFYLGKKIPGIDQYLLPIIVGIIVVSLLPALIHLYKERRGNHG